MAVGHLCKETEAALMLIFFPYVQPVEMPLLTPARTAFVSHRFREVRVATPTVLTVRAAASLERIRPL